MAPSPRICAPGGALGSSLPSSGAFGSRETRQHGAHTVPTPWRHGSGACPLTHNPARSRPGSQHWSQSQDEDENPVGLGRITLSTEQLHTATPSGG